MNAAMMRDQRIEIISNASESEISELPDIADLPPPKPPPKRRAPAKQRGATLSL